MNGADHYLAAEQLLQVTEDYDHEDRGMLIKQAHVHAMLAVAAATIQGSKQIIESSDGAGAPVDRATWAEPTGWAEWAGVLGHD